MTKTTLNSPSVWAQGLGYSGLIPFVGLALTIWLWPTYRAQAAHALLAYGATIASFLGAIHWGLAMRAPQEPSTTLLAWGVVPSLLAWVAQLLAPTTGILLIAAILWACFAVDRVVYTSSGLRAWLPMRLLLTVVASLSCIAAAFVLRGSAA